MTKFKHLNFELHLTFEFKNLNFFHHLPYFSFFK